jgi:hypothetical protein
MLYLIQPGLTLGYLLRSVLTSIFPAVSDMLHDSLLYEVVWFVLFLCDVCNYFSGCLFVSSLIADVFWKGLCIMNL